MITCVTPCVLDSSVTCCPSVCVCVSLCSSLCICVSVCLRTSLCLRVSHVSPLPSLGNSLALLTMDPEYQRDRERERTKAAKGSNLDLLHHGGARVLGGFVDGFSGVSWPVLLPPVPRDLYLHGQWRLCT